MSYTISFRNTNVKVYDSENIEHKKIVGNFGFCHSSVFPLNFKMKNNGIFCGLICKETI